MKYFYGVLALLGTILPYSQFIPWVYEQGFDIRQFIYEAGQSQISGFAWMDILVASAVLIGFILYEGRKKQMKHLWLPVIATVTVGVSLGLPLFLLLREIKKERMQTSIEKQSTFQ